MHQRVLRTGPAGLLLACVVAGSATADEPPWLNDVQTFSMLPVLPETAEKMHISVNGIWAGISSDHPILPSEEMIRSVRRKYGSDVKTLVSDCRRAGLVVCGVVNGIEGMDQLRERFGNLEKMACRKADGQLASNGQWLLMCTNNPDWMDAEFQLGQTAIDDGAQLLLLDTPMGSAFLSGGLLKAGFCRHCLSNFERCLKEKYTPKQLSERFGIERFDARAVIDRLGPCQEFQHGKRPFQGDTPDDLLFQEFILCQERASFETRKRLVERLREYARQQGRPVAFCTNAADLGTMNPAGHWVRGIMFADLVDFFAYEMNVLPDGFPRQELTPLPRGKWAAYHKLAHAIYGRRSPAVLHAGSMGSMMLDVMVFGKYTTSSWFGALCAEAYAANGAFTVYHIEAPFGWTFGLNRFWGETTKFNGFVQSHSDLYEGDLRSGSPLAILFLFNERGRTIPGVFPSYLGFAQALIEGNYPFDVVFGGDGRYVQRRIELETLKRYSTILVPSPISPTENQKRAVQAFVRSGGTLICQEPDRLGISVAFEAVQRSCLSGSASLGQGHVLRLAGEVTSTWTNDIGADFFKRYDAGLRHQIHDLAEAAGVGAILEDQHDGLVGAFTTVQPRRKRVLVHLVNYDIDTKKDNVREKNNLLVRLPATMLPAGRLRAEIYAPGEEQPQKVALGEAGRTVSCAVPRLGLAATLAIGVADGAEK